MSNNNENTLFALLAGAAIGAGIGVLYAPDKGTKTRGKIKHKAEDIKHDISERVTHAKEDLTRSVNEKKQEIKDKLDETISHMNGKAEDIIASLESKLEELKKMEPQQK
jgi:gas vesicle protein